MTHAEMHVALRMARRGQTDDPGLLFDGFGLRDFKPVTCTLRHLAWLISWQCFCFNGSIDANALDEIAHFGRKRFLVIAEPTALQPDH